MSHTYPIHTRDVPPLPPLPTPLVYWGRDIPSVSAETGQPVVNAYVTTGGFLPDAADQKRAHLHHVGTLIADFDLSDFLFGKIIQPEKADAAIADLKRVCPGQKESDLRKILMYRLARKDAAKFTAIRAQHLVFVEELLAQVTPGTVPTKITDSGWGYHVYWWLETPATDNAAIDSARELNALLVRAINRAAGFSVADDGVHDCGTRILRAVGTVNTKDVVGGPREVVVVRDNPDARWGADAEVVDVDPPASAVSDAASPSGSQSTVEVLFTVPTVLPEAVQAVLATSPKLQKLFSGQGKAAVSPDGTALDMSGSGYDMSLACALARKGVGQVDIAAALHLRNGGRKDLRHCNRTAAKAAEGLTPGTTRKRKDLEKAGAQPDVVKLLSTSKLGEPRPTLSNAVTVLLHDTRWKGVLYFEERTLEVRFDDARVEAVRTMLSVPRRRTTAIQDEDHIAMRRWLSENYLFEPSKEIVADATLHVAQTRTRNTLIDWLTSCASGWDRVPRADTWLRDYAGVVDSPLTRAYARKFLLAAVARAYMQQDHPTDGVKVDTILILKGAQGRGKSTLLRALAGPGGFSDSRFDVHHKDSFLAIRRPWIYECAELANLNRKEAEDIKQFISSQSDNFRPPYGKISCDFPRQGLFVGSTNRETFLNDPTGSRRYWPVTVGKIDVEGLQAVLEQLWGEAVVAYRAGEKHWLDEAQEGERERDAEQYAVEDPGRQKVARWIGTIRPRPFTSAEVMEGALQVGVVDFDRWKNKTAEWLLSLGCERMPRTTIDGAKITPWRAPAHLYEQGVKPTTDLEDLSSPPPTIPPTLEDQILAAWVAQDTPRWAALMQAHPQVGNRVMNNMN